MSKRVADVLVETLQAAGVKRCYGIVGDTLNRIAHAIHSFASGSWASFDATYFGGGRTTVNGILSNDLLQNWRVGATYSMPIDRRNSIKLYASSGVSARTGNNFDLLGIAWQYRWGAGL